MIEKYKAFLKEKIYFFTIYVLQLKKENKANISN